MNFIKQLPLGKTNPDDGLADFEDGFPMRFDSRPDYQKFNEKVFSSEEDCVSALVGIAMVNLFSLRIEKRFAELVHAGEGNPGFPRSKEYDTLMDLDRMLREIQEVMGLGRASGKIEFYEHKELIGNPVIKEILEYHSCYFEEYRFYNRLSFLSWMKENSYPIPDELNEAFGQKKNGSKSKPFQIITPGGKWCQIHFRIVHSDRVEVIHPGGMTPFSPDEIGLLRKKRLHRLFEKFATDEEYIKADKQDISDLNTYLKKMLPFIEGGKPIINAKKKNTSSKVTKRYIPTDQKNAKIKESGYYTAIFHIQKED